jgi:4-alpha-glucanotransferase
MTEPLITDESINKTFGGKDEYVKVFYLERNANNTYRLKEQFNTQRKIEHAFEGKNDEESRNMRDGLYYMAGDVLFIRDRINSSMFHPRISSQFGYMYSRLSKQQQQAYNLLYDDYFYKRHNQFWYDEAMKKLPCLIQATKMLVCAEDLGMVPDCVPWVMDRLRILSLEIFSMPKDSSSEFGVIENYPYRSVATISTHDMPTLREWWEEDYARSRRFYNNVLKIDGTAPEVLPGWLAEEIVSRHLYSPSMMCIISLQDWLAIDDKLRYSDCRKERINVPANQHHYWRYRMHITIGQLKKQHKFNSLVHDLIVHSER